MVNQLLNLSKANPSLTTYHCLLVQSQLIRASNRCGELVASEFWVSASLPDALEAPAGDAKVRQDQLKQTPHGNAVLEIHPPVPSIHAINGSNGLLADKNQHSFQFPWCLGNLLDEAMAFTTPSCCQLATFPGMPHHEKWMVLNLQHYS